MKREDKNTKEVKFDNLYDLLFDNNGDLKSRETQIQFTGDRLDFLEQSGQNIHFSAKDP